MFTQIMLFCAAFSSLLRCKVFSGVGPLEIVPSSPRLFDDLLSFLADFLAGGFLRLRLPSYSPVPRPRQVLKEGFFRLIASCLALTAHCSYGNS